MSARHAPELTIAFSASAGKAHVPFLRRHLPEAARLIKSPLAELSVALVGDRTMSKLHEQFMGLAGPTDVLSFPLETDQRGRVTAGEVVICVPEAQRQAKSRRISLRHEVLLYAIHGLLHLSGYDDQSEAGFGRMHRAEDRILTMLGIGAVFAPMDKTMQSGRPARRRGR